MTDNNKIENGTREPQQYIRSDPPINSSIDDNSSTAYPTRQHVGVIMTGNDLPTTVMKTNDVVASSPASQIVPNMPSASPSMSTLNNKGTNGAELTDDVSVTSAVASRSLLQEEEQESRSLSFLDRFRSHLTRYPLISFTVFGIVIFSMGFLCAFLIFKNGQPVVVRTSTALQHQHLTQPIRNSPADNNHTHTNTMSQMVDLHNLSNINIYGNATPQLHQGGSSLLSVEGLRTVDGRNDLREELSSKVIHTELEDHRSSILSIDEIFSKIFHDFSSSMGFVSGSPQQLEHVGTSTPATHMIMYV